jgi:hypothetical protein
MLRRGETDAAIQTHLVGRFTESILVAAVNTIYALSPCQEITVTVDNSPSCQVFCAHYSSFTMAQGLSTR